MAEQLAALERGPRDAPPVVLLHGLARNAADLALVAAGLADRHRVISLDLRGHGRSPDGPWTFEHVLADVRHTLEHLGVERPVVVGHSLGGMVAALLAAQPDPVLRAAVNLDGHGGAADPDDRARALAQVPGTLDLEPTVAQVRAAAPAAAVPADHLEAVLRRSVDPRGVWRPGPEVVGSALDAVAALDLPATYAEAKVPLTVVRAARRTGGVVGEEERHAAVDAALATLTHPLVRVVTLDADHGLVGTAPGLVLDVLAEVLAR